MSVWDNYAGATPLPQGTPELQIRAAEGSHLVYANGNLVHADPMYEAAHRWCMNTYGLTSTQMLPVYSDYATSLPAPNPYRKESEK